MGMIVSMKMINKILRNIYIYDGQQRITNLILFFLACSRAYEDFGKKNDVENYKVFSNKIINRFALDEQAFGSNEEFVYTITLGNINNDFIKEYIYQNKPFPLVKKLPETNKLMRKAFMKYYDEINNLIAETTAIAEDVVEDVRKVISKLVHTISEGFYS